MATTRAKALRRAGIDARIDAAGRTLAARFGVAVPDAGPHQKDRDLAVLAERERLVGLLEAVVAATDPDAAPYAPDLDAMTRKDLDAHAAERGIDPSAHRTKADLIAAIRAAEPTEPTGPADEPMPPPTGDDDGAPDAGARGRRWHEDG